MIYQQPSMRCFYWRTSSTDIAYFMFILGCENNVLIEIKKIILPKILCQILYAVNRNKLNVRAYAVKKMELAFNSPGEKNYVLIPYERVFAVIARVLFV